MSGQSEKKCWLVWSEEHGAWWRANRHGYTNSIRQAGRYTIEEANKCCNMRDRLQDGAPAEWRMLAPEADIEWFTLGQGGNLKLLYEIREALGLNDKTSLSILPDTARRLRKLAPAEPV